jgi:hypothetical protein
LPGPVGLTVAVSERMIHRGESAGYPYCALGIQITQLFRNLVNEMDPPPA